MITKTVPATTRYPLMGYVSLYGQPPFQSTSMIKTGASTISYDPGPKYVNYRCNWKRCVQDTTKGYSGSVGVWNFSATNRQNGQTTWFNQKVIPREPLTASGSLPSVASVVESAWAKVHDNLDLNTRESVLLYSGVLQAVPLVGGCFKFLSIMNRLGRKLSKSFKQKPFTTVLKTAISADFIDRFVVSPTIDDARRFIDANNYVVNVMNTMYQRSQPLPTAIRQRASSREVSSTSTTTVYLPFSASLWSGQTPFVRCDLFREKTAEAEAFLLAELSYNTSAVDPIKLWADRCGVTRPLDSIWDLIPFSFVVDYFTRAGDFISGLSDSMAHQDGLKGTIRRIHGSWVTSKSFNGYRYVGSEGVANLRRPSDFKDVLDHFSPGTFRSGSYQFRRYPTNPWSMPEVYSVSDLVHLNLSQTRTRTLAELIIQAKLR